MWVNNIMLLLLLSICLALEAFGAAVGHEGKGLIFGKDDPTVTIAQGKLKGKKIENSGQRIDRFLAIPYAEAPTGDLRFRAPVPHGGWGGDVYDAGVDLDYKLREKTCLQSFTGFGVMGSEDCLYVSVWVSGGVEEASKSHLPVMVWIHGGAFVAGSGWGANAFDNWLYDQEPMTRHGNIVAVTLNYRLGPLGFLSTGDDASPGNYGLLDQVEALRWVKNNIWAFGGDVDRITIYGESAGSASVSFHMLSPLSMDLFHRGISQSGTAYSSWAVISDPLRWAEQLAGVVNCPTVSTQEMVDCIRQAPVNDVVRAIKLLDFSREVLVDMPWSAVIDGNFLPDTIENLAINSANKDYLIGNNNMDGHMFAGAVFPTINMDQQTMDLSDLESASTLFQYQVPQQVSDAVVFQYRAYTEDVDDTFYKKAVTNVFTDRMFAAGTHWTAQLHAKMPETTGSTYVYLFSHPSKMPVLYPPWMGADHADDLQYVFAKPFKTPLVYTDEEREMSDALMTYWTNFAWSGDPNSGPNGHATPATWPLFQVETRYYLEINGSLTENGNSSVGSSYRADYEAFWSIFVPQLWDSSTQTCEVTTKTTDKVRNTKTITQCPGDRTFQRETKNGCVQGTSTSWNGKMLSKFLGIPYAAPPVGSQRFQYPTEIASWSGVKDTTQFAKICPQNPYNSATMSEDCLYLNVYVPVDTTLSIDDVTPNKYPVMVWIHGGNYDSGDGSEMFQADVLTAQNNVIVVTINYRLGSLGFFTTGNSQAKGNYGLLDQNMALHWIRDNIPYFSGDPNRVVIFGQGAGAEAVQLHTLTELSSDLGFNQAILESGTAVVLNSYPNQLDTSSRFATNCLCSEPDAMITCLQNVAVEDLMKAQESDEIQFAPVVDYYFLKDDPTHLMTPNSPFSKWSFIIGSNSADGSTYWSNIEKVQSVENFHSNIMNSFNANYGIKTQDIEFEYVVWTDPAFTTKKIELQSQLLNLYTDYRYVAPAAQVANAAANLGSTVYLYDFSRATPNNPNQDSYPSWSGAVHKAEIPYVWGNVVRDVLSQGMNPEDSLLSFSVMNYWSNFAKTGNPNTDSLGQSASVQWPPYDANNRKYLSLDATTAALSFLRGKQVEFWNTLLPTLQVTCSMSLV